MFPHGGQDGGQQEDGEVLERPQYKAFGAPENEPTSDIRARFTGHEQDLDIGLTNMKGRIYDHVLGRFLTPDPFLDPSNRASIANRYAYVGNDPINRWDPFGFHPHDNDGGDDPEESNDTPLPSGWENEDETGFCEGGCQMLPAKYTPPSEAAAAPPPPSPAGGGDSGGSDATSDPESELGDNEADDDAGASPGEDAEKEQMDREWEAAKEGAWDWWIVGAIDHFRYAPPPPMVPNLPQPLKDAAAEALEDALTHGEPSEPALRDSYNNMQTTLTVIQWASGVAGGGGGGVVRQLQKLKGVRRAPGGSVGAQRAPRYEPNPKHGNVPRGNIAAEPKNGPAALRNSIPIGGNSNRRVGIDYDADEFVVFAEHLPGVFHGYVVSWGQLTQGMQSALRKAGMASKKGKILGD